MVFQIISKDNVLDGSRNHGIGLQSVTDAVAFIMGV